MNDNKFLLPAISAVTLAVLFPAYWFTQVSSISMNGGEAIYNDVIALNPTDFVFLLIGVLSIYVYLSFKKFLNERHAYHGADIPLFLLVGTIAVYTFSSLAMDLFMQFYSDQLHLPWHKSVLDINTFALVVSTVIIGVLDIILGVVLFTRARDFSSVLRVFSIVVVIQGFFEMTVVFSPLTFVIFPLALVLLAVLFMREPEMLDVV